MNVELSSQNASGAHSIHDELDKLKIEGDARLTHQCNRLLEFIAHVQKHCTGPDLAAFRSHLRLHLFPCEFEDVVDRADVYVSASDTGDYYSVTSRLPPRLNRLPLTCTVSFATQGVVQTSIALIDALSIALRDLRVSSTTLGYMNGTSTMHAGSDHGQVVCPWCNLEFSIDNSLAWDGTMHLFCGQRLELDL